MPRLVWRARYYSHFHESVNLNGPAENVHELFTYTIRAALAHADDPQWALLADKYAVRKEVERLVGPGHLIPLEGCWEDPADIDPAKLTYPVIFKTNNGCATNIFCKTQQDFDAATMVPKLRKALRDPYPYLTGQHHYAHIKPRVIAERLMEQGGGHTSLTDYKIFCVNGKPMLIVRISDRDEAEHFKFDVSFFTSDFRKIPAGTEPYVPSPQDPVSPEKPQELPQMLDIAAKLSAGIELVRVDLYLIDGTIYFGEMTLTPDTRMTGIYQNGTYQSCFSQLVEAIHNDRRKGISKETF